MQAEYSIPLPAFVNKVLLELGHAHSLTYTKELPQKPYDLKSLKILGWPKCSFGFSHKMALVALNCL